MRLESVFKRRKVVCESLWRKFDCKESHAVMGHTQQMHAVANLLPWPWDVDLIWSGRPESYGGPKLPNTQSKTTTTIDLEERTISLEGTTTGLEGPTLSLEGTAKRFPSISTFPCHFYFMFALNFVLLLLAPKPTTREKQLLYASRTHNVVAPTSVQGHIAAADHPLVPHGHLYQYWSTDGSIVTRMH